MLLQQQMMMAKPGAQPVSYRAKNSRTGAGATTTPKPAGITVGDVVLVIVPDGLATTVTLTTASGSAWTKASVGPTINSYTYQAFWKVLDATDVANAWNFSSSISHVFSVAYVPNGPATVGTGSSSADAASGSTAVFPGFAPSNDAKGVVAVMMDRDSGSTDTAPTDFAARESSVYSSWKANLADRVAGYAGSTVTWTNTGTVNHDIAGWLFEIRSY